MFMLENHGLIFDAARQPPEGRIAYFTSLCPLRSGAILCGFQNGPGKHAPTSTIRLCRRWTAANRGCCRSGSRRVERCSRFLGCGRTRRSRTGATAAVRHVV